MLGNVLMREAENPPSSTQKTKEACRQNLRMVREHDSEALGNELMLRMWCSVFVVVMSQVFPSDQHTKQKIIWSNLP